MVAEEKRLCGIYTSSCNKVLCTSDLYVIFGVHFYVFGVILKCKEITEHFLHFLHLSAMEKLPMHARLPAHAHAAR